MNSGLELYLPNYITPLPGIAAFCFVFSVPITATLYNQQKHDDFALRETQAINSETLLFHIKENQAKIWNNLCLITARDWDFISSPFCVARIPIVLIS